MNRRRVTWVAAAFAISAALGFVASSSLRLLAPKPREPTVAAGSAQDPAASPGSRPRGIGASSEEQGGLRAKLSLPPPPMLPEPRLWPRPSTEWQGQLVDLSAAPTCESTELCSFGQACKDGLCLPCEADRECLPGEVCVLDHCLGSELVSCRSAKDCGGSYCMLSEPTTPPRHNDGQRAFCVDADAALPLPPEDPEPYGPDTRPPPLGQALLERVEGSFGAPLR
jgi:hypothetical protein